MRSSKLMITYTDYFLGKEDFFILFGTFGQNMQKNNFIFKIKILKKYSLEKTKDFN